MFLVMGIGFGLISHVLHKNGLEKPAGLCAILAVVNAVCFGVMLFGG